MTVQNYSHKSEAYFGRARKDMLPLFPVGGVSSKEALMVRLIDLILSNSKAGLIDLNLVKQQKVLSATSSPDFMKDYSVHLLQGKPKEGQSLEELRDLLLEQIEKIKKGEFDEELLKGIIANAMVDDIKNFDSYNGLAYSLLDAFVTDRKWRDVLNINYEMSKITKKEIVDFANEYYTNGYSIVYKRTGEDTKQDKIEKPQITEVSLNRDKSSQFVMDVLEEETDSIHPVFLDYNKDFDGKDIYEGDILEYVSYMRDENKRKEIVEFDEKCGGWYVHKQADTLADVLFKQHNEEWQIKQNYTPSLKHKVRIIGNIYENHELTQTTS